jgi:hypothetical protein
VIDIRSIVGLLVAALVATAAYAEPTAAPKAQAPETTPKPAKAAKQTAPRSGDINLKRDLNEGWSEMRRAPQEIKKGVPAAGRDARDQFKSGWNKAKEGFTGAVPPTIPDRPN